MVCPLLYWLACARLGTINASLGAALRAALPSNLAYSLETTP
jgi:hypothetical protein